MDVPLLPALAAVALVLTVAGLIAHRLRLPSAVGYLAVGLVLSPYMKGTPTLPVDIVDHLAQLGVLFLLFFIGLELDIKRLQEILATTIVSTVVELGVTALAIAAALHLMGWDLIPSVALGLAMCVSSTIFGERLSSRSDFSRLARQRVVGTLLGEDLAAVVLLGILVVLSAGGSASLATPLYAFGKLAFLLILIASVALLVVPKALDKLAALHLHELVVLGGSGLLILFGAVGAWAGSAELGALLAGVACAEAGSRYVVRNALAPLREISLAIFLMASGMAVDAQALRPAVVPAAILAGLFVLSKTLLNAPTALRAGLDLPSALRTGLALGTLGEFSLILLATAEDHGIAHPQARAILFATLLIVLVATPLALQGVPALVRLGAHAPARWRRTAATTITLSSRPVKETVPAKAARRAAWRPLAANLVLLVAWVGLALGFGPQVPLPSGWGWPILLFGLLLAGAMPFLYNSYRAYRDLVRTLAGVSHAQGKDATTEKTRSRLVDAWVVATVALILVPATLLWAQRPWPYLVGGLVVAALVIAVAGRQMARFHAAMTQSVKRVLGQDAAQGEALDQVLAQYPWGVHFAAVAVPRGSPVAGHTLKASRLAELTGATVAVVQRGGTEHVSPDPAMVLQAQDTLVLMGDAHQLAKAEAIVVSHGEALRLTAQSRLATVAEVTVPAGSALAGQSLREADVRTRTGATVAGIWKAGRAHPDPFRDDALVATGDRLILLGSPLQVQRARDLAEAMNAGGGQADSRSGWGDVLG